MGRRKIDKLTVFIKGEPWIIRFLSKKQFDENWPDALGITTYNQEKSLREIYFRKEAISKNTIAHELMHAYFYYYDYSKDSRPDIEEEVCNRIGKIYSRLYHLTNHIYKRFTKK